MTSFIGRQKELSGIKQAVAGHRLVTLIGPGGTGKTRLALQAAGELIETFPDGVWFVAFAPLADPALVLKTVVTTLGLREETGLSLPDILTDYLRAKQVLLVLDNCEHLVEASARINRKSPERLPALAGDRQQPGGAGGARRKHLPCSAPIHS